MLKIKLAHFGKKKQPRYRFVVTEANSKRDSGHVAELGQYSPTLTPKILNLDIKAYKDWIKKGAQPTDTVASLAKRFESGNPFPAKKAKLSKKALAKKQARETEKQTPQPETKTPVKTEAEPTQPEARTPAPESKPQSEPKPEKEPETQEAKTKIEVEKK